MIGVLTRSITEAPGPLPSEVDFQQRLPHARSLRQPTTHWGGPGWQAASGSIV